MIQMSSKEFMINRLFNIDFLKAIAVLLIINSHLDSLYPTSALATGGALGNGLFFVISGYLIRNKKKNFYFIIRSLIRVYIPLYVVYFVSFIQRGYLDKLSIHKYIWPTSFWFIGAIILFYILYSLLERIGVFNHFMLFILICIIVYVLWYFFFLDTSTWIVEKPGLSDADSSFKLVYYFAIMMLGGYVVDLLKNNTKICFSNTVWIFSIIVMYYSKYVMIKYPEYMKYQFISQLCVLFFSFFILMSSFYWSFPEKLFNHSIFSLFIITISTTSLECYLVQFSIIELCKKLVFPLNVFSAVLLILISGILLKSICDFIMRLININSKRNGMNN